jgi:carbamoyl-phosphate synthase large subunit
VVGLMNVQFAIQQARAMVYVLEVNPRASRTVPFVSKAIGAAAGQDRRALHGRAQTLADAGRRRRGRCRRTTRVKEAVFPFIKFPGVDTDPRPRDEAPPARSWASAQTFGEAFAQERSSAAGSRLPRPGTVVISVRERRQGARRGELARELHALGFQLVATRGTAAAIAAAGVPVRAVNKVKDGRPHIVDLDQGRRDPA